MNMAFMQEGGMQDDGGETEPKSGNKVPSGSLKEEVADDIPAMLSEGEFVFPADVVRYIGLETLMKMRQDAKQGLKMMEKMGQLGNPDEAEIPDDIPFGMADLVVISGEMKKDKEEKAEGGVVGLQEGGSIAPVVADDRYFGMTPEQIMQDEIDFYKKRTGRTFTPSQITEYAEASRKYYDDFFTKDRLGKTGVATPMPFMGIDEYFPEQKDEAPTGGGGLFDDERFKPADTGQGDPTVYTDEDIKQIQEGLTDVPAPGDITIKKLVNKDNPDDFIMHPFEGDEPLFDIPDNYVVDESEPTRPVTSRQPIVQADDDRDRSKGLAPLQAPQVTSLLDPRDEDITKAMEQVTAEIKDNEGRVVETLYDKNGRPITLQKQTLDQFKTELDAINKIEGVDLSFKEYYNLPTRDKVRFSLQARLGTPPTKEQVDNAIKKAKSPTGLTGILSPITSLIRNVFSAEAYSKDEVDIDTEFQNIKTAQDNLNKLIDPRVDSPYGKTGVARDKATISNKEYERYLNDAKVASGAMFESTGVMGKADDFLMGVKRDPRKPDAPVQVFTGKTAENPDGFSPLTADALGRIEKNKQDIQNTIQQNVLTKGKTAVPTGPDSFMYVPSQESGDSEAKARARDENPVEYALSQNPAYQSQAELANPFSGGGGGGFGGGGFGFGYYVGGVPTKPMKPQRLKKGGLAKPKVKPKRMKKGGLASRKK
jgi:hypothetical protein